MTDNKLILNIQLFAETGDAGEGGTGESGMRNEEFGMKAESESEVREMNAEGASDALDDEASECGMQNAECGMNEEDTSDALDDGAGNDEEKESDIKDAEDDEFVREREERLRNRISGWLSESKGIKELYPDFDLRNELRSSPLFSRLVLSGAPLQAAYEIVHKDEILSGAMAYTADRVREQVVKNIETKGRRPLENGISSESAVMTAVDVNALTAKDIHRILKQVENGASIKF